MNNPKDAPKKSSIEINQDFIDQQKKKHKPKKTVLIFGISSFVGSNLAEFLKDHFRVIGTYYSCPTHIQDVLTIRCDILSRDSIQAIMYKFLPDITIYCTGLTSIDDCDRQDKYADALNTVGLANVHTFCERYKSRIYYISSSYIFDGRNRKNQENDSPSPTTVYGKTKVASEFYLQKNSLNYMIFRCCPLYGRSYNPGQMNLFEALERKFFNGQSFVCDNRIFTGYLDVQYLGVIIKKTIELDYTNRLIQISSNDIMTPYEFARTQAEIFDYDKNLIQKGSWKFSELKVEVPGRLSDVAHYLLDINNFKNLFSADLPSIKESLEFTKTKLTGNTSEKSLEVQSKKEAKKKDIGINFI